MEKDKKRRSGTSKQKDWKYFSKIDGFLSDKHNAEPPLLVDTMAEFDDSITEKTDIPNSGRYYIGIKTFFSGIQINISQVKNECRI